MRTAVPIGYATIIPLIHVLSNFLYQADSLVDRYFLNYNIAIFLLSTTEKIGTGLFSM